VSDKTKIIFWPLVSGSVTAIIFCLLIYYLPLNYGQDFLALLLASISSVYLASALKERQTKITLTEVVVFLVIFFIAFIGLYYFSFILGAGYFLHAVWSFFHSPHRLGVNIGNYLPRFCLSFNFLIALFIFIYSL